MLAEQTCDQSKASIPDLDQDDAKNRVEAFALNVFEHADNRDRSGKVDKATAASFQASYVIMDVCKQFGELSSDVRT